MDMITSHKTIYQSLPINFMTQNYRGESQRAENVSSLTHWQLISYHWVCHFVIMIVIMNQNYQAQVKLNIQVSTNLQDEK